MKDGFTGQEAPRVEVFKAMSSPTPFPSSEEIPESLDKVPLRPRRPWLHKFKVAFRGLKLGVRGHSSFFVHFFFAALVLAAGFVFLRDDWLSWGVILGCIGVVLVAELFNSAVETVFRALDPATKERAWPALDIAAGAVLLASLFAAVIGCLVFLPKLIAMISSITNAS